MEAIIMSEVIPIIYSPSESMLSVDVDVAGLFGSIDYMNWKEELEDILNGIDLKYAKIAFSRFQIHIL